MENKIFDGENARKGLKSRLTISDGISSIIAIVTEKSFSKIDQAEWIKSVKYSIIMIESKDLQLNTSSNKKLIILKDKFVLAYSGLK